jgi:hypothetical protein
MRATREESLQPLKTFIYDNRVHKNINAVLKSGDPKGHYLDYIVDYLYSRSFRGPWNDTFITLHSQESVLSFMSIANIHMRKCTHTKPDVLYVYPIALRAASARAACKFTFGLKKQLFSVFDTCFCSW